MKLELFDYKLPDRLIAQTHAQPRDHSRLFILDKETGKSEHRHFSDLADLLEKDDVLVLNNSKVIPARLWGKKESGARVEVFLLKKIDESHWEALIGKKGAQKVGWVINFEHGLSATVTKKITDSIYEITFNKTGNELWDLIERIGSTPLPPYIKRNKGELVKDADYQTVYAKEKGSVAAPTAGLHFTSELLAKLQSKGVQIEYVTLHVGWGTFAPIKTDDVERHDIHEEFYELSKKTADALNKAKTAGKRIVVVGTTAARTLESAADDTGVLVPGDRWTKIYIYPGYKFKFVDSLITNFHVPKSSLLVLVSALAGREVILKAYREAIEREYRFFSYGDAMWIR